MFYQRVQTWSQNISLFFIAAVFVILTVGLIGYQERNQSMDLETKEDTVMKYAIQCYASEGSYPPDLVYLENNYGLIVDKNKYIYHYEIFGSNVPPIIDVQVNAYTGGQ